MGKYNNIINSGTNGVSNWMNYLDDDFSNNIDKTNFAKNYIEIYRHQNPDIYINTARYQNKGVGFYTYIITKTSFNLLKCKVYTLGKTAQYNIYTSSTYPTTTFNPNTLTLLTSINKYCDVVNSEGFMEILLPEPLTIEKNKYIIVLAIIDGTSNISCGRWNASPGEATYRILYSATTTNIFTNNWSIGSGLYMSEPPVIELLNSSYINRQEINTEIEAKLSKTTFGNGSEIVYQSNIPSVYDGNSTYANYGVGMYFYNQTESIFNKLLLKATCDEVVEIKLYKGTILPVASSTIDFNSTSSYTLIHHITNILLSDDIDIFSEIFLDQTITIPKGFYVYILITANDNVNLSTMKRWTSDYTGSLLFSLNMDTWNNTWKVGGATYFQVPVKTELSLTPTVIDYDSLINFQLPSILYAVEGIEYNIYTNTLYENIMEYECEITCSTLGKMYSDRYSILPLSDDIGDHILTFKFYKNNTYIASYTRTLTIIASSISQIKNILLIGDSILSNTGGIEFAINEALNNINGGTSTNFIGTYISNNIRHEGRPGWTWNNFATNNRLPYFKFIISNISVAPSIGSVYIHNASTYTVREVNLTGDNGYINCQRTAGTTDPQISGTLTKSSGNGDNTIVFSSWGLDTANPFWNNDMIDFNNYMSILGESGTIDVAIFMLGANEAISSSSLINSIDVDSQILVDALLTHNPSCQIIIMMPLLTSDRNGFAANYGANTSWKTVRKNLFKISEILLEKYDINTYSSNVLIGNARTSLNPVWGYPTIESTPASRYSNSITIQANGLHPSLEGGKEVGDNWSAYIIKNII